MSSPIARTRHVMPDHATKMAIPMNKNVGHYGSVKKVIEKRGGAGRGCWGKPGSELEAPRALNPNDPNFDEYEDTSVVINDFTLLTSGDIRRIAVEDILVECIESDDVKEALSLLNSRKYIEGADFVEACVAFGVEHHAYERELISQLLCEAHSIFEGKGYEEGFQRILYNLPDLTLDSPGAPEYVGLFIARCMYDEVLPPKFLREAVVENDEAKLAMALAYNKDKTPVERARLEHVWGPVGLSSVDRLREEVDSILTEYLVSHDISEAGRAIVELHSPSFMSQVVKQAVYAGIEAGNHKPRELILGLLNSWAKSGILTDFQLFHGFELAVRNLDEIRLDVPGADELLNEAIAGAKKLGLLASSFAEDEVKA